MEFTKKRMLIRILVLCSILGLSIITCLSLFYRKELSQPSGEIKSSSKLAYGKGISFVEYEGDKKIYAVSIDSFSIERAKIGPFAIGPLHVARLNKVTVDLNLDEIEPRLGKEGTEEKGGKGKH